MRLPKPGAGRLAVAACWLMNWADDGAFWVVGAWLVTSGSLGFPGLIFLLGGPSSDDTLGAVLVALLCLLQVVAVVLALTVARRTVVVPRHIDGDWLPVDTSLRRLDCMRSVDLCQVWLDYRSLKEPALRAVGSQVWLALQHAVQEWDTDRTGSRDRILRRAKVLEDLAAEQRRIAAARIRAQSGVAGDEDVEHAVHLLAALRELDQ